MAVGCRTTGDAAGARRADVGVCSSGGAETAGLRNDAPVGPMTVGRNLSFVSGTVGLQEKWPRTSLNVPVKPRPTGAYSQPLSPCMTLPSCTTLNSPNSLDSW